MKSGRSIYGIRGPRVLLGLLLIASASLSLAQDLKLTYGKTYAQILAMGYVPWWDHYVQKAGNADESINRANHLYAEALGWRNRNLLAKQPVAAQGRLKELQTQLEAYGDSVLKVTKMMDGAKYSVAAQGANAVDIQETMYVLLGGRGPKIEALTASAVRKDFGRLEKDAMTKSPPASRPEVEAILSMAKLQLETILKHSNTLVRNHREHVFRYCAGVLTRRSY